MLFLSEGRASCLYTTFACELAHTGIHQKEVTAGPSNLNYSQLQLSDWTFQKLNEHLQCWLLSSTVRRQNITWPAAGIKLEG